MSSVPHYDCDRCDESHERRAFISHASKDKKIAKEIAKACCNAEVTPYLFEFSPDFSNPKIPADTLSQRVNESNILFVLLGDQVSKAFWTQAWIGFEIGVARGIDVAENRTNWQNYSGKRVIAVQDIHQGIEVSVPRLNALLLFNFNSKKMRNEFEDAIYAYERRDAAACGGAGVGCGCVPSGCGLIFAQRRRVWPTVTAGQPHGQSSSLGALTTCHTSMLS